MPKGIYKRNPEMKIFGNWSKERKLSHSKSCKDKSGTFVRTDYHKKIYKDSKNLYYSNLEYRIQHKYDCRNNGNYTRTEECNNAHKVKHTGNSGIYIRTDKQKRNQKEAQNRPDVKEKKSRKLKGQKRSEVQKLNMSKAQIIVANRPELKRKRELLMKEMAKKPEIREKIMSTKAQHIADGTIKAKMFNTKPELLRLAQQIKNGFIEGKTIIKQYHCKGVGIVDFYYPETNTLEFIDGDYWHCNPAKYKADYYHKNIKLTAQQIWDRDRRITEKAISLGYKVNRIWERDI